jgi:hypothetical protein
MREMPFLFNLSLQNARHDNSAIAVSPEFPRTERPVS